MKTANLVKIIEVAGPLLLDLIDVLLKHWGPQRQDDIVNSAYIFIDWGSFVDEYGTKFKWTPQSVQDERRLVKWLEEKVREAAAAKGTARRPR